MLDLYLPDLELDEYENCQTIPKYKISCARDLVQLTEVDKSSLFLAVFFLSNFYVLIEHIKKKKLKYFVEKFNSKLREVFEAKYSGRSDFSQHKFIESNRITLFQSLLSRKNFPRFWQAIIKKFQNTVELKNALDEMHHGGNFGDDSLKEVAKSFGVGYQRARRLVKV
jgi:hypothetical protein